MNIEKLILRAQELQPWMTEIRRDFHRFPETGWLEMRTSARIAKELDAMGYRVITGRDAVAEGVRMGVPEEKETAAHVVDTIGAGDSHAGATLLGLCRGMTLKSSLAMANRVSAAVVETDGATLSDEDFARVVPV